LCDIPTCVKYALKFREKGAGSSGSLKKRDWDVGREKKIGRRRKTLESD